MKRTCKTCNPARYCPDRGTVEVCAQWVADPDDERFIHPGTYAEIDATAIAGIGLLPGTPESDALVNKMIDDSRLVDVGTPEEWEECAKEFAKELRAKRASGKMDIVRQRAFGQCGPACVATVLGCGLDEVLADFAECEKLGTDDRQIAEFLTSRGVPALASTEWPSRYISAILTVPSLNHPGMLHYVAWDAEQQCILDPTNEEKAWPEDGPEPANGAITYWTTAILLWRRGDPLVE